MTVSIRDLERELINTSLGSSAGEDIRPPVVLVPRGSDGELDLAVYEQVRHYKNIATRCLDLFHPMLLELLLVRHPYLKADPEQLRVKLSNLTEEYSRGGGTDSAGSWIWYQDGLLFHLLRPEDHYLLRTSRNLGLLSSEDLGRVRNARVVVAGLSVGGQCATTLAMEGFRNFLLADFDVLSCSNLNRLPSSIACIGRPKTAITAEKIWNIDPFASIDLEPRGYSSEYDDSIFASQSGRPGVVVDAIDSVDDKVAIRKACKKYRVPVVAVMDVGDGVVQITCERYDQDSELPLFGGRLERQEAKLGRSLNFFDAIVSLVNPEYIGPEILEAFHSACHGSLPGVPQIAGTVSVAAGAVAWVVRSIVLGRETLPEFAVQVAEKADPNYWSNKVESDSKVHGLLSEFGLT